MGTDDARPAGVEIAPPSGYRLEDVLGRGGMGAVYRVTELATGRSVALKRLLLGGGDEGASRKGRRWIRLFEREYHTLAQLEHPRIIFVYDYGVDDAGPYYTMELLPGADLRARAPLPWREACALLRDVASSLSVLASRRLVHRDVSPGNVRCTPDGRAKLIDFGAMSPAGIAEDVVGTPPCVPPEGLYSEELDARSDLYALGATLYFALTREHAYPTRQLPELPRAWRKPPEAPSQRAPDVPEALDALVLSLLSLRPEGRPSSAAEVIERLEVIAGLEPDASNDTAQAYLRTPTLVGRDDILERFRHALKGLSRRRGACHWIVGESGIGRTRLLDAMALESRLAGVHALHGHTGESPDAEFGIERLFVRQLLRVSPEHFLREAAPHADALVEIEPELVARLEATRPDPPLVREQRISRAHVALREVLVAMSRLHPLVLLADDVHQATATELAFLVGIARAVPQKRILLVASADTEAEGQAPEALAMLRSLCAETRLERFAAEETRALLASMFADPPELDSLVTWLHGKTDGNPGLCMELTQHLVERGSVRHAGGVWLLPHDLSGLAVPESLEQLRARRLAALSPDAQAIVRALSLMVGVTGLDAAECASLLEGADAPARAHRALSQLEAGVHVVDRGGGAYRLREATDEAAVADTLGEAERSAIFRRLAHVFEARGEFSLELAYFLQRSGRDVEAHEVIVEHRYEIASSFDMHRAPYAPEVWRAALASARRTTARPADITAFLLLNLASDLATGQGGGEASYGEQAVEHLRRDTGADIWGTLPDSLPAAERSQRAIALAAQAHEARPPAERGLPPDEALARLRDCIALHLGILLRENRGYDAHVLLPLLEPFKALSPASAFYSRMISSIVDRVRGLECRDVMLALLDETERGEGLDQAEHRALFRARLGFQLAGLETLRSSDCDRWLALADELRADPLYAFMGWQIRLNHALAQADALAAAAAAREHNLALAQSLMRGEGYEAACLQWDVLGYGRLDDLVALKRLLEPTQALAQRYAGWRSLACIARAEYQRARGELDKALLECEAALRDRPCAPSELWGRITARICEIEARLGRGEAALARVRPALEEARACGADRAQIEEVELALGLAEAVAGDPERGVARIVDVLDSLEAPTPALLAHGRELLARAAVCAGDAALFISSVEAALDACRAGLYSTVIARCERLDTEGRRALGLPAAAKPARAGDVCDDTESIVRSALSQVAPAERLDRALGLLLEHSGAQTGYLFRITDDAPELVAGGLEDSAESTALREYVAQYVERSCETALQTVTATLTGQASTAYWPLPSGASCVGIPIGCTHKNEVVLAGIACLVPSRDEPLEVPWTLTQVLAEYLLDAGDLAPLALPSL